ncbi:VOC family protein [Kribbella catacumbae]|uniref:VOC family protein n=1 Tax=Kribbella catacumbae TaxID=460086 RepID=UPI00036EA6E0|nr:VOC family protein [Kribbella catacumbae]
MRPVLRKVDAVTIRVPDLDSGLAFYRDKLGHELLWRHDEIGQAGLGLPESETEIVLATGLDYAPSWLVGDADEAAAAIVEAGGELISAPFDIPVGRCAVVADAFGNQLVLLDLSTGRYETDGNGSVTGVAKPGCGNP